MKFVDLVVTVLVRMENYKEAINFLEDKKAFFERN